MCRLLAQVQRQQGAVPAFLVGEICLLKVHCKLAGDFLAEWNSCLQRKVYLSPG